MMHSFSTRLQALLDIIRHCSEHCDGTAYLHGDSLVSGDPLCKEVNILISYDMGFSVKDFYPYLMQKIVVDREIEKSDTYYHIISNGFELKIGLFYQFDPTRLAQTKQFGQFNVDMFFYNLSNQQLKHPPEISDDVTVLFSINNPEKWSSEDVLGFARKIGTLSEININKNQKKILRNISLGTQNSFDISWNEEIENILLSRHPGLALRFLTETFVDGMPWVFKALVDYMISIDVSINEESTIETVFSEKKFELLNLYGDYFAENLSKTSEEIHLRIATTLKILFNSPNLVIPNPIKRIQIMADGTLGRCCLGTKVGIDIVFVGCGENIEEEDCLGLPVFCQGGNPCLKEHPAFSHIPDNIWQNMTITSREWCPDQVCPDEDNVHCLEETSSSSSGSGSSSGSSSSSSSSSSGSSSSGSSSSGSSSSMSSSSSQSSSSSSSGDSSSAGDIA